MLWEERRRNGIYIAHKESFCIESFVKTHQKAESSGLLPLYLCAKHAGKNVGIFEPVILISASITSECPETCYLTGPLEGGPLSWERKTRTTLIHLLDIYTKLCRNRARRFSSDLCHPINRLFSPLPIQKMLPSAGGWYREDEEELLLSGPWVIEWDWNVCSTSTTLPLTVHFGYGMSHWFRVI